MHVITFSVSIFFSFSPGLEVTIIVMASCLPFAFSRLRFWLYFPWGVISSFCHYTFKGKDKNKGQDDQRKVRQHFSCFLVLVVGIKLSYRATLRRTGYACLWVLSLYLSCQQPALHWSCKGYSFVIVYNLNSKKGNFPLVLDWLFP